MIPELERVILQQEREGNVTFNQVYRAISLFTKGNTQFEFQKQGIDTSRHQYVYCVPSNTLLTTFLFSTNKQINVYQWSDERHPEPPPRPFSAGAQRMSAHSIPVIGSRPFFEEPQRQPAPQSENSKFAATVKQ